MNWDFSTETKDNSVEKLIKLTCRLITELVREFRQGKTDNIYLYSVRTDLYGERKSLITIDVDLLKDYQKIIENGILDSSSIKTSVQYIIKEYYDTLNDFKDSDLYKSYLSNNPSVNADLTILLAYFKEMLYHIQPEHERKEKLKENNIEDGQLSYITKTLYLINDITSLLNNLKQEQQREVFAEKLRRICKEKKITQVAIARQFNLKQQSVNAWFTGKKFPTVERLLEISNYLETSVDYLLNPETNYVDLSEDYISKKYNLQPPALSYLTSLHKGQDDNTITTINFVLENMENNSLIHAIREYLKPSHNLESFVFDRRSLEILKESLAELGNISDNFERNDFLNNFFDERLYPYTDYQEENHLLWGIVKELVKLKHNQDKELYY